MAQMANNEALPRLVAKPLVKISHATMDGNHATPKWTHVTERDDLVLVLDHARVMAAPQQYEERRVLRVVCGPDLIAALDLDDRMRHPSMDLYRRYGSQISLEQLSLGFLVRGTNLKITYTTDPAQRRVLQLKFKSDADCQDMASVFGRLGLPVKAGVGGDRPASRRLSTAGSWSATPPNSQHRNTWSSHGSSSSQTLHAPEPSFPLELPHLGSQARLQLPGSEMPRISSGFSSSPRSADHAPSTVPLELRDVFSRAVLSRDVSNTSQAARSGLYSGASYQPPNPPAISSPQGRGYGYQFSGGAGELLERYPVAPLDTIRQAHAFPSQGIGESGHLSRPPSATHTSTVSSMRPSHIMGTQGYRDPGMTASSSYTSQIPLPASEALHRPWTVHGSGGMAPPPLPDRIGTSQGRSTNRAPSQSPSVGIRSSERLAAKRPSTGLDDETDRGHIQRPSPSFVSATPHRLSEQHPRRELPIGTPNSTKAANTATYDTAALDILAETASAATVENAPVPSIEPPAAPAPKGKGTRSPKKTAPKTTKAAAKTSTGPAKKRAPRKTKAQAKAEAEAKAQAKADAKAELQAQAQVQPQGEDQVPGHIPVPAPSSIQAQASIGTPASTLVQAQAQTPVPAPVPALPLPPPQALASVPVQPPALPPVQVPAALPQVLSPVSALAPASTLAPAPSPVPAPFPVLAQHPCPSPAAPITAQGEDKPAKDLDIPVSFGGYSEHMIPAVAGSPQARPAPGPVDLPIGMPSKVPDDPAIPPPLPGPTRPQQGIDEADQIPQTPQPPPVSPLTPPALPPGAEPSFLGGEEVAPVFLSREDAESLFDQRFRETMGGYLAKIGPCLADIEGCLRRIVEANNELAGS